MKHYGISPWEINVITSILDKRFQTEDEEIENTDTLFVNRDKEPDVILNSYHTVIIEETIKYFENRFDEYCESLKNTLTGEGINVIVS